MKRRKQKQGIKQKKRRKQRVYKQRCKQKLGSKHK